MMMSSIDIVMRFFRRMQHTLAARQPDGPRRLMAPSVSWYHTPRRRYENLRHHPPQALLIAGEGSITKESEGELCSGVPRLVVRVVHGF